MLNFLINFVFPKKCFGCGMYGEYLCAECVKKTDLVEFLRCPVCQKKAIDGQAHPFCAGSKSLNGIVSFYQYRPPIQTLLKALKYSFVFDMSKELAALIDIGLKSAANNTTFMSFLAQKPLIVPVPLHWQRHNWRGFNQAEIIGGLTAGRLKLKLARHLLVRQKKSRPQAELKKKERLVNVRHLFGLNVSGQELLASAKNILLIDDIWTTGATMRECGRVLKKGGAKKVWGLTLAG